MKKLSFLLLLFVSGVFAQGKFHVSGTLDCAYSGKIYLYYEDTTDSVFATNKSFEFHGNLKSQNSEAIIRLEKPRAVETFFLEAGEIKLDGICRQPKSPDCKDCWDLGLKNVEGSKSHDRYRQFMADSKSYQSGKMTKEQLLSNGKSAIERYPESPVSIYILERLTLYFSETDRDFLRNLFSKLKLAHDTNSITANSKIFDKLYPEKTAVVNAPMQHFKLPDEKGKIFNSETLKGKWILLDFWASWCAGCIEEFPRLKKLYGKKNLEIISISIDADKQSWLKTAAKAKLPWTNLRSAVYSDKVAAIYRTYKGIPLFYLVNPEGIIVAKNPTPAELEAWMK